MHFEEYARAWPEPIRRRGGQLIGYFLPTKLAGSTSAALALIEFPNLEAYEKYREALGADSAAAANVAAIESRVHPLRGPVLFTPHSLAR